MVCSSERREPTRALRRYTATPLAAPVLSDEAVHADIRAHTPLGRVAQSEEVSGEACGCT